MINKMDIHHKTQFCLICCAEVERRVAGGTVIKEEVVDSDENEVVNNTSEGEEGPSLTLPFTETLKEEKQNVFDCVYKLFNVKKSHCDMWRRERGGGDNAGDDEDFPFCERCSTQLLLLFKLQNKVEELGKAIKMKVISSENKFERSNVYKIDKRYYKIRKSVLEEKDNESRADGKKPPKKERRGGSPKREKSHEVVVNCLSSNPPPPLVKFGVSELLKGSFKRRISSREPKHVSRFGVGEALSTNLDGAGEPIVVLSKEDKHKAERYQDSFVKVEQQPINVLDDDEDDDEDENYEEVSTADPLYEPPSPAHTWSHEDDDDNGEDDYDLDVEVSDGSGSWILPTSNVSKKKRKLDKTTTRKNDVHVEADSTNKRNGKEETLVKKKPKRFRRRRGRPRKDGRDSFELSSSDELSGPALKFKKSAMTKVDRKTGTITFLKVPLARMEGGLNYQCTLCSEILPNAKRFMSAHVIREHTDRFVCTICGKRLSSTTMLKTHLRAHTGAAPKIKTYCPICAKPYTRQYLVDMHRWTHYSEEEKNEAIMRGDKIPPEYEKKFQCEQCAKRFASKHLLQRHHVTNHLTEEERSKELCPTCGIAVIDLRGHVARVHQEVPEDQKFACTQCEKKFARYVNLSRHKQMVHCNERKFKCGMCPREFATKKQLNEHTLVHMNIRRFQCEFCASAFVKKHHLQRHTRIYHDDGSQPRRPAFIRGPEKKTMEQRNCFKNQSQPETGGEVY